MSDPVLSSGEIQIRRQLTEDFFVQIGNEQIFSELKQSLLDYLDSLTPPSESEEENA